MIETREQRKKKSLLRRRLIAVIVSAVLALVLIVTSLVTYFYFSSVYYFTDVDEAQTKYTIKKVNGEFALYDKNGNLVPTEKALDSSDLYYVTEFGTTIDLDPETGEYTIKYLPALNFADEFVDHELLTIFKSIDDKNIRSIEVNNQEGSYTLWRYNITELRQDDSAAFVLKESPVSSINKDKLSYITYYAGHALVNSRLEDPIKDSNGLYTEYGLVEQEKVDKDGNTYTYKPSSYTVTTTEGKTYTILIGYRLIDGNGYYVQYIGNDNVARDAVYIFNPSDMSSLNGANFTNTLLASAKSLVEPMLTYPSTQNDYYDVTDFTIKQKNESGTDYRQIVGFSYVDIADRTGTVLGIHPYFFLDNSFNNYHPNYDSIDNTMLALMDPKIVGVAVLAPKNEDKYNYGLMKRTEQADGTYKYEYDSEYVISYNKVIKDQTTGEKQTINQTIYVSKPNENGNYYTFTVIRFVDAPETAVIKGVALDTICEVSPESLGFVDWDEYDWVYPNFMEIAIAYAKKLELVSKDYNATFNIHSSKDGEISIMEVEANYESNGETGSVKTFGILKFTDAEGYLWTVTPSRIYMHDSNGKEYKPSTRSFEYNSIGEQVHVIGDYANTRNGDFIYVDKDYVTVKYADGRVDKFLRYHNTIFKKLFGSITTTGIVDSYIMDPADEQALLSNPDNHLLTVKITDEEDTVFTYSFYSLTARKSYITVTQQKAGEAQADKPTGGFYIQSTRVTKMISDAKKFFAQEDIDYTAHK